MGKGDVYMFETVSVEDGLCKDKQEAVQYMDTVIRKQEVLVEKCWCEAELVSKESNKRDRRNQWWVARGLTQPPGKGQEASRKQHEDPGLHGP